MALVCFLWLECGGRTEHGPWHGVPVYGGLYCAPCAHSPTYRNGRPGGNGRRTYADDTQPTGSLADTQSECEHSDAQCWVDKHRRRKSSCDGDATFRDINKCGAEKAPHLLRRFYFNNLRLDLFRFGDDQSEHAILEGRVRLVSLDRHAQVN